MSGGGGDYSPGPGWSKSESGSTRTWTSPDGSKSSVYDKGGGRVANVNHITGSCQTFESSSGIK